MGKNIIKFTDLKSAIVQGDALDVVYDLPEDSVQLVFTSPPYFNAKPEYYEVDDYAEYLNMLRNFWEYVYSVLSEGRFLVVNTSPILIPRKNRSSSSTRYAIPYEIHIDILDAGFEFIDDIIWVKPEGAGVGRSRRFSLDRQPLQYKTVPITENIMVYRKQTDKLIDWNIKNHPDRQAVKDSLIPDDYERTNVWYLNPARHKIHPAIFPDELAERIITYYSFKGDMVLDPFAGVGTVGRVAHKLGRRFYMIENKEEYFDVMQEELKHITDKEVMI